MVLSPILKTPETKGKIIVATHSLPFHISLSGSKWQLVPRIGHSAQYAAIRSLSPEEKVLHIGWTGNIIKDDVVMKPEEISDEMKKELKGLVSNDLDRVPLFLGESVASGHYEEYCKSSKRFLKGIVVGEKLLI